MLIYSHIESIINILKFLSKMIFSDFLFFFNPFGHIVQHP